MASPFPQTDTLTAEQYHRLRDGPTDNGAHVEAIEPVPAPPERACRGCGGRLPDGAVATKVWCSDKCRRRDRTGREAQGRRSGRAKPADVTAGPPAAREVDLKSARPLPISGVGGLVAGLVARPDWTEVTITFDGFMVTVTARP